MSREMEEIFWDGIAEEPLGIVWAAVRDKKLIAVAIGGDADGFSQMLAQRYHNRLTRSKDQIAPLIRQIKAYLHGERKTFEIQIDWAVMSPFQTKVLQAVFAIPYGEKRSYAQIADQVGMPKAARAVGRANATNPIPLVIPCHRVIGADGSLRGYGSGNGIKTKAWLLHLEKGII
ncbi:MAG: methylated-DNA--[protein]-cysteine S-methyltransferase [Anaerolineales bacterium]